MENIVEIKAKSKKEAIERALKILEAEENQIKSVIEIQKPKSFLGLFAKDGLYKIEISRNKNIKIDDDECDQNVTKNIIDENYVKEIAQNLLNKMQLDLKVEILRFEGRNCILNLYGEDNGIIIGKKGKTLNSYEYLLNILIKEIRIDVDVEGFKEKRNITLRDLARKMSEKALRTNKPIRLNPMPPRERKIIHEVVNKYSELDTYSEGKDPKRYIVIRKKR